MAPYDPEKITFFAKTDARGQRVPFGIKARDRQRHMYVIGKTGMGKSTLLENMAAQDLKTGEGMAFIDPHGSAIEVLLDYVPEDRIDDVVYFAPFDMENPIAFNIMEDVGIDKRHLVVSGLMSTFKKIWVDAWSARMEYILTNALLALIEYPGTTLLSVNRMLADKKYRDKVVENIKDPAVKAYWVDEFASYTERFAAEALPAIQNKIGQFTGNPLIRNIIGQPHSSFDVRKMMDEKKILLINLSKGLVGETNADLIGSMLITKIYLAAMSRAELPPAQMKQMPNFYFYVDEFQSFANATFANILSEARKYHLNLIIAHQYVQQMEEEIRDAVFGNVGTTISFRVGPFDAEVLETVFAPEFEATDLVNLGFAQIYLSLMIDGVGSRPFSAITLPPVETPPKSFKQMVVKRSQQNFCRPRSEVEQAVIDSHSPDKRIDAAVETGGGNKGSFAKPSFMKKVGTETKGPPKKNNNSPNQRAGGPDKPGNHQAKQPPKTAADLKAVLAGMTGQNNKPKPDANTAATAKSDTNTVPAETKAAEKPQPKPQPSTPETKEAVQGTKDQSDKSKLTPPTPTPTPAPTPTPTPDPVPTKSAPRPDTSATKPPTDGNQPRSGTDPNHKANPDQKSAPAARSNQGAHNNQQSTSADDLRAVLAKLANKTNQTKLKPDNKLNGNGNSNSNSRSKPNQNTKPTPQTPLADQKPVTSPTDLRHVLQDMVAHKKQPSNANQQPQSNQTTSNNRPTKVHTAQPDQTKPDLKTALADVVAKSRPSTEQTPPNPVAEATTGQPSAKPVAEPTATMANNQPTHSTAGRSRQPAFTPHEHSTGPDINTAKKILRHSGKERPPGT